MTSADWGRVTLKGFCQKIGSGSTPRGGDSIYIDEGAALIRSQNVYNGEFAYEGLAFLGDNEAEALRGVTVQAGDVLLNITGDSVARCCVAPEDVLPARVNQHVAIIRPRPDEFVARFLAYYLISPFMQETMLSMAGGGGTRKALTKDMIERFMVPKPPLDHQERIVAMLGGYDDLIDNNRRRIKLLEDSVRLLFDEWFVRLKFPGHEIAAIADGVPRGWSKLPLGEVLILQRGFDLPSHDREAGDIAIFGSTGIVGFHNKARVTGPGIVTGRSGTLGEVHFVAGDFWPLNTALWVKEYKRVKPLFALHLLRGMNLGQYNGGVSVPTLDRKVVHKAEILLPPVALMARFDEVAKDVRQQIDTLAAMNDKLRAARDLLLPRLMSGELTV